MVEYWAQGFRWCLKWLIQAIRKQLSWCRLWHVGVDWL